MNTPRPYTIFPLGDSAITIDLGNCIDVQKNRKVLAMQEWLKQNKIEGIKDIIAGYSSLSILYDAFFIHQKLKLQTTAFQFMSDQLETAYRSAPQLPANEMQTISIPVCYSRKFGYDLDFISNQKQIPVEEIIQLHTSMDYRVFMIGFLPGFAYLGEVDERIRVPRKEKPSQVVAGSVGIANSQTGIYPLNSPGGWQIVGRTPLKLFDPADESPVKLTAGQYVRFYAIGEKEFAEMQEKAAG